MLDETTPKGRLIAAAIRLAAEHDWKDVSLIDIAEAAGVTLADVRTHFDGKPGIVRAFVRAIDDELLKNARKTQPGEGARDALFEVIMARFDLLTPYKPAIRSILRDADFDPAMIGSALASQSWMLSAAGIDASGSRGAFRTLGLASVYGSIFHTWLDDDDPGMARTMASLDRRLRRGERNLETIEGICSSATGFARRLGELFTGGTRRSDRTADRSPPPGEPTMRPSPPEAGPSAGMDPSSPAG